LPLLLTLMVPPAVLVSHVPFGAANPGVAPPPCVQLANVTAPVLMVTERTWMKMGMQAEVTPLVLEVCPAPELEPQAPAEAFGLAELFPTTVGVTVKVCTTVAVRVRVGLMLATTEAVCVGVIDAN